VRSLPPAHNVPRRCVPLPHRGSQPERHEELARSGTGDLETRKARPKPRRSFAVGSLLVELGSRSGLLGVLESRWECGPAFAGRLAVELWVGVFAYVGSGLGDDDLEWVRLGVGVVAYSGHLPGDT